MTSTEERDAKACDDYHRQHENLVALLDLAGGGEDRLWAVYLIFDFESALLAYRDALLRRQSPVRQQ